MTREEFRNSFVNNAYSFSCMTVKDLMNIIESWPSDNMPFCIEDEWSWRGIYADPCLYVSNAIQTKSHNLRMLHELLKYSFTFSTDMFGLISAFFLLELPSEKIELIKTNIIAIPNIIRYT